MLAFEKADRSATVIIGLDHLISKINKMALLSLAATGKGHSGSDKGIVFNGFSFTDTSI